jgi:transcriptional regulator with XRE-family HTH domain
MINQQAIDLRTRKLAILLRDARESAGRTKRECADALGIPSSRYGSYENATKAPSLPELEILAFFLDVPLSHFWGNTAISQAAQDESQIEKLQRVLDLRQRILGTMLRVYREEKEISVAELSRLTNLPTSRIKGYEEGRFAIPLPDLEMIIQHLGRSMAEFYDSHGPVGDWLREQNAIQELMLMPSEIQEFVCKPLNRPYIEIAQRLSEMSVDKLRAVAEGLLEITL